MIIYSTINIRLYWQNNHKISITSNIVIYEKKYIFARNSIAVIYFFII